MPVAAEPMRKVRMAASAGVEILVNVALPYLVYVKTLPHLNEVRALLAASLPPIVWSIIQFARSRKIDAVSILVVAGIVLSLLAFLGGGGVRFLQLRENLVGGLVALAFLGSAAIGRPLIYELARAGASRRSTEHRDELVALRDNPMFRRSMTIMTLVWGFGLLANTVLACVLVFSLTIPHYLLISPFIGYGTMGGLALWTFWYAKWRRRKRLTIEAHPATAPVTSPD